MNGKKNRAIIIYICLFVLSITVFAMFVSGCTESKAVNTVRRADLVTIDDMKTFGRLKRPAVAFPHDAHTEALAKEGKSCDACHQKLENGVQSSLFLRTENTDYKTVMDIYHKGCIDCHKESDSTGKAPVTCGDCHSRNPKFVSSWTPIGFDKSLHFRHAEANKQKCELCHHVYDDKTKKLKYVKNQESSCRDCHKKEKIDNRISFEQAAHEQCFTCHLENKDTGPTTCAGCHDKTKQQAIKVVKKPARLFRNQPDFVLLHAPDSELSLSKLPTVPFSHIDHEEWMDNCRTCHHESMKPCDECHGLEIDYSISGIPLQQSMHALKSEHSCVGCHDKQKANVECAGCHSLMEQGTLSQHACTICHSGPEPDKLKKSQNKFTSINQFKPSAKEYRLSFKQKDIPDTVRIKTLSKKYEEAVFPHKKIIEVLRKNINDSKIAVFFHGDEDVLCQGCHHHTPIGETPPLCESCHNKPFNREDLFKPGLYGAFHRQCLGCHQAMNITKPSDCVGCHAKKTTSGDNR